MASDRPTSATQKVESNEHEAVLTGVMALANLYSNCVEAFGLIHPGPKWEKEEQLLLCRLGLQQARLLTWGDVVGVSSPPTSVTDRAIPRHPSAAYPDLKEPTFFGARDERLDQTETRQTIESALSDIVDRSAHTSRDEMMAKYGLKSPKKFSQDTHITLDTNRLEGFRERYELLKEVAETYAQISSRRNSSLTQSCWIIADHRKFGSFIKLTQEKVDLLINLMGVKENVDRAVQMDIKALGWHLSADRQKLAQDISKLRMIAETSTEEYPEYVGATQQALDNIERERRENVVGYNPYAAMMTAPVTIPSIHPAQENARRGSTPLLHATQLSQTNGNSHGSAHKDKKPGVFGGLFKFGRKPHHEINAGRSQSVSAATPASPTYEDPARSLSHPGHTLPGTADSMEPLGPARSKSVGATLETAPDKLRSKSVGHILDAPTETEEEEILKQKLERLNTNATVDDDPMGEGGMDGMEPISSAISRHDQYHGLARQGTRTQW